MEDTLYNASYFMYDLSYHFLSLAITSWEWFAEYISINTFYLKKFLCIQLSFSLSIIFMLNMFIKLTFFSPSITTIWMCTDNLWPWFEKWKAGESTIMVFSSSSLNQLPLRPALVHGKWFVYKPICEKYICKLRIHWS